MRLARAALASSLLLGVAVQIGFGAESTDPPPSNGAPTIMGADDIQVRPGRTATLAISATDPEGAGVRLVAEVELAEGQTRPDWLPGSWEVDYAVDPQLAIVVSPPDDAAPESFEISVSATDGSLSADAELTFEVISPLCSGALEFDDGGECSACPPHRLPNISHLRCDPCPADQQRPTGAEACAACPAGETSESGGACEPNFEVSPPTEVRVGEGAGSVTVTVAAAANARDAGFSLDWSTTAGTAAEGSDYEAGSGTLAFAAGDFAAPGYRAAKDLSVTILDDEVREGDEESFSVSFSASGAGSEGVDLVIASTTVWIRDDDEPIPLTLSASPAAVDESGGARTVTVTATLESAPGSDLAVPLSFGGTATETTDYAVSGTRSIAIAGTAASGSTDLTVTPVNDAVADHGETIEIGSTLSGHEVAAATVTIEEPPMIALSVADASVDEAVGAVTVTMVLNNPPPAGNVYRRCGLREVEGGTADLNDDYTLETHDLGDRKLRAPGWSLETTLTVVDNDQSEEDETVVVKGFCATSNDKAMPPHDGLLATPLTLTIRDDDDPIPLTLSASPTALDESGGARTVTVTAALDSAPGSALPVPLSFGGTATETTDYAVTGTRSIAMAGTATSGSTELTVTPANDAVADHGETIVIVSTLSGYEVAAATVTIEEPPTIVLSVADASVEESVGAVTVTMTLNNPRTGSVYRRCGLSEVEGGTADLNDDYTLETHDLGDRKLRAPGWSLETTLTVVDNDQSEEDETVVVKGFCATSNDKAMPPHDGLLATPLTLTIRDDDSSDSIGLSLSTSPAAVTEGDGATQVTVSGTLTGLSTSPASDVTATLSVGGDAIDGLDYTLTGSKTLMIAAGDATLTDDTVLTLTALADDLEEGDERIEFQVTQVTRGGTVEMLSEPASVSVLIADAWAVPPAPTGLDVVPTPGEPTRSLSVSWTAPEASPSIRSYHVDHRLAGGADWPRKTVPASETSTAVGSLKAGMDYEVRAAAENAAGEGRPTGVVPVSTQQLPCAPGAPDVAPPDGGADAELSVSWDAAADCGATIDRYRVRYREDPARETAAGEYREQAVSGLTTTLRGLTASTWYAVEVQAESDAAGMSRWSPTGAGRTKGVPERVERPAAAGGDRAIDVDWDAPGDGGYPITDYDVWYRKSGDAAWLTHAFECGDADPCPTSTTISSRLDADTTYNVQVRAQNSSGPGKWSPRAAAKTLKQLAASFGAADYAVERNATVVVTVELDPAPDRVVSVPVTTAPASGEFELAPAAAAFMEEEPAKSLAFTANDSANPDAETVTLRFGTLPPGVIEGPTPTAMVAIAGAAPNNTAPVFLEGETTMRSVNENLASGAAVGPPVAAADAEDDPLTYALSGADAALFAVDGGGQISLAAGKSLNHENATSHAVTLTAADGGNPYGAEADSADDSIEVMIMVGDVDEPPGDVYAPHLTMGADGALSVTWRAPPNKGPPITDYDVRYRTLYESSDMYKAHEFDGAGTSTTIPDLGVCAAYIVQVRASNDEGTGRWHFAGFEPHDCPEVSIGITDITEGETAMFTLTSDEAVTALSVNVGCSASGADAAGHPFSGLGASAVTVSGTSATRSIGTTLDQAAEPDGSVTCTVNPGTGYAVGDPNSATARVDNSGGAIYTLTVEEPTAGTVTGGGIDCGSTATNDVCSVNKEVGARVTLTAAADAGHIKGGWGGDCRAAGTGTTCALTMNGDRAASKAFRPLRPTITIARPSNGHVIGMAGNTTVIDCGPGTRGDCAETVDSGTDVALTPHPDTDHRFGAWSGECAAATAVVDDMTCAASFVRQYTLTVTEPTRGTVTGGGIDCGAATTNDVCTVRKDANASVTLTAAPDTGRLQGRWGGDCRAAKRAPTCALTMDGDKTASKDFPATEATRTVAYGSASYRATEGGAAARITVTLSPAAEETVTVPIAVTAGTAEPGDYSVSGLTGNALTFASGENSNTFTIAANQDGDTDDETVALGFGALPSGLTGGRTSTLTIDDDDAPPATLTITRPTNGHVIGTVGNATVIDCGPGARSDCAETVDSGTNVSLTPHPGANHRFDGWSGGCSAATTVNGDMTCAASFVRQYTLTVTEPTHGTVTGGGINCGTATTNDVCVVKKDANASVTLRANPATGHVQGAWGGDCEHAGTSATCTFAMNRDKTVSKAFAAQPTRATLTITPSANGHVIGMVGNQMVINCGSGGRSDCAETVDSSTNVSLTPHPGADHRFDRWSGGCSATTTVDADMTCQPVFVRQYTLTVTEPTGGTVTGGGIDCGTATTNDVCVVKKDANAPVTLTANPATGHVQGAWGGDCEHAGTSATCTFTMNGDKTVSKAFAAQPTRATLTITPSANGHVVGMVGNQVVVDCGPGARTDCAETVDSGTDVSLDPTSNVGYRFDRWTGGCSATTTVDADMTCQPVFVRQYTLTVTEPTGGTVTGGGIDCGTATTNDVCVVKKDANASVTLRANPTNGREQGSWGGDCEHAGTSATCTFTMNGDKTVSKAFAAQPTRATLTITPSANGHVVGMVGNQVVIDCGPGARTDCAETVDSGTDVSLDPTSNVGYRFDRWTGGCSATTTVDADMTCQPVFVRQYTLTVTEPTGGTVAGGGIDCGTATTDDVCVVKKDANAPVTLTANPATGHVQGAWGGDCEHAGTSATCTFTMNGDKTVSKAFAAQPTRATLTITPSANGHVVGMVGNQVVVDCGPGARTDCAETVDSGTDVSLDPTSNVGYRFDRWTGGCSATTTVDADMTCQPVFVRQYTLTVTEPTHGTVTGGGINCGTATTNDVCVVKKDANAPVTLTANPATGHIQGAWGGDCSHAGTSATCTFTMNGDKTVSKAFAAQPTRATLTITPSANGHVVGMVGNQVVIDCGPGARTDCAETVDSGTEVSLDPTSNVGYRFDRWTGGCSATTTVDADMTCQPVFVRQYTLTVTEPTGGTVTGGGINCGTATTNDVCVVKKDANASVTLTATPATGREQGNWGGDCSHAGTSATCTFTMNGDKTVSKDFLTLYMLRIDRPLHGYVIGRVGSRTVINCGSGNRTKCKATLESGTELSLDVTSNVGYRFDRWTGGCSATTTVDADMTCQPVFVRQYTLTVTEPTGGTVAGGGINCGTATTNDVCVVKKDANTPVTLRATPDTGREQGSWGGDCEHAGTSATCTFTMNGDKTVSKDFSIRHMLTIDRPLHGYVIGRVGSRTVISCGSGNRTRCKATLESGTEVSLTPHPGADYRFDRWSGGCSATTTVDADMTCQPVFVRQYTLTVTEPTGGTVAGGGINCGTATTNDVCVVKKDANAPVTLTANPATGHVQGAWGGDCEHAGTSATCTFTMNGDKTVSKDFSIRHMLTIDRPLHGYVIGRVGSRTVISCGSGNRADCKETVNSGTLVSLTPYPDTGYHFGGWTGGCSATTTVDADMTCEPSFLENPICSSTLDECTPGTADPLAVDDVLTPDPTDRWTCASGRETVTCSLPRPCGANEIADLTGGVLSCVCETGYERGTNGVCMPSKVCTITGLTGGTATRNSASGWTFSDAFSVDCDGATPTVRASSTATAGISGTYTLSASGAETAVSSDRTVSVVVTATATDRKTATQTVGVKLMKDACGAVSCRGDDCSKWSHDDGGSCVQGHYTDTTDTDDYWKWTCGGKQCEEERPPVENCAAAEETWTVGTYTCSASRPHIRHEESATVSSTATSDNTRTGSATFACFDGDLARSGETCACGDACLCLITGGTWVEERGERPRTCTGNDACTPGSHTHSCTTPADPNGGYSSCEYNRHRGGIYCASHRTEICEPYPAVPAHCHVELEPCEICCELGEEEYCP